MFRQFRANSAPLKIEIPGLTERQKYKYNIVLLYAFDVEERLFMGPHGRKVMLEIMHRCLENLEHRTLQPQQHLPIKTVIKIIFRNKDILFDALERDLNEESFFFALRPRHASKKERLSPPSR